MGWIVRTEIAERYWRVGEADPNRAAQMARYAASAEAARAITKIPTHVLPEFSIAPGAVTEIIWETKQIASPFRLPVLRNQIDGSGAKGEITFDIVVPEEGATVVEGCYRINGGNWQVYIFAKQGWSESTFGRSPPHVRRDAVFSSGISGVSGIVPASSVLNKKTVMTILAEAVAVEEWTEVSGLDSLMLK